MKLLDKKQSVFLFTYIISLLVSTKILVYLWLCFLDLKPLRKKKILYKEQKFVLFQAVLELLFNVLRMSREDNTTIAIEILLCGYCELN